VTDAPGRRLAVVASALGAALAALIGWVEIHRRRPLSWDVALHAAALHHRTPSLTAVALAVTTSAEGMAYAVAAVGGFLALRPRPWWLGALAGAAVLAVGQLLRLGIASWVGRARPPTADWAAPAGGYALPSGHTTTATLAAGLLCLGLARTKSGVWRATGITVAVCWAVTVGATRVYLGVHWPTDVLGGWLLGTLLTVLAAAALLRAAGPAAMPARSAPLGPQRPEQQPEGGQL
jgi:membrane-associated phospholipid phosphatase